jgi:hypothetical protein
LLKSGISSWILRSLERHTSFRESMAGKELSNSVTSSPSLPPPRRSPSPSRNATLSLPVANWLASSPSKAFSRERKSSPPAGSKPESSFGLASAVWSQQEVVQF